MLRNCFSVEYRVQLTEKQLDNIYNDIVELYNSKALYLDILLDNNLLKGFIIYQVDSPYSDWNEKEGYGFIREVYVVDELRKKGYGKKMVFHAERILQELDVPKIYITADDSKEFWIKMGYQETGEICQRNGGYILEKL